VCETILDGGEGEAKSRGPAKNRGKLSNPSGRIRKADREKGGPAPGRETHVGVLVEGTPGKNLFIRTCLRNPWQSDSTKKK